MGHSVRHIRLVEAYGEGLRPPEVLGRAFATSDEATVLFGFFRARMSLPTTPIGFALPDAALPYQHPVGIRSVSTVHPVVGTINHMPVIDGVEFRTPIGDILVGSPNMAVSRVEMRTSYAHMPWRPLGIDDSPTPGYFTDQEGMLVAQSLVLQAAHAANNGRLLPSRANKS